MSRVSPEKILSAIASSRAVAKTGASVALNVYAVPMGNFPGGLPIDLKHFLKEPDDLKDFASGVELDFNQFYLLDDSAPRSSLGLNVRVLNFFQKVHTTLDLGRPETVLALSLHWRCLQTERACPQYWTQRRQGSHRRRGV